MGRPRDVVCRLGRLLGKFYIHQEDNVLFMTKKVNFAFFPWTLLGHSKKTLR